jgi:soluble lytic murein transglycosylase-like protein
LAWRRFRHDDQNGSVCSSGDDVPIMPTLPRSALAALALALSPLSVLADCIDDAAVRHHVNADVLRAIGWQESRLQPEAVGLNRDGSVDVGAFQINSVHLHELARYGIDLDALTDGCVCADVAAWHYRRQIDLQGDNWRAVGAYHSRTAARAAWYANPVADTLAPGRPPAPRSVVPAPPPATLRPPFDRSAEGFGEIAYLPSTH